MCTTVWARRAGRVVEITSVRDFARVVGVLIEHKYRGRPRSERSLRRFADHCLCPVDVEASAKAGGWELAPTEGWPDYMLRRTRITKR